MTEKLQFNIYLPPNLIRRVKHAAIEADKSLSVYVEELLGAEVGPHAAATAAAAPLTLMPIAYVRSMAESLRFYRALGLSLRHEGDTWSELGLGDAVLALHAMEKPPPGPSPVVAFVCRERLESLIDRLRTEGLSQPLEIVDEAYGRSLLLRDPDGLSIQINEHDPDLYQS